jgi:single-stranded DNA-binding protein
MGVRIVGRLKQNTWGDGGVTHSEVQVIAEHIEMRSKK